MLRVAPAHASLRSRSLPTGGSPALALSLLWSWWVPRLSMLRSGAQGERCCGGDHAGAGLWPPVGFLDELEQSVIPDQVVETVSRATSRLMTADLPCVLGHADFDAQNLRWQGAEPWTVHDWGKHFSAGLP